MSRRAAWLQWALPFLLVLSFSAFARSSDAAEPGILVEPGSIDIGMLFDGMKVEVSAEIPERCNAVLEILGKNIEEQLLRKGKHWDIWMNVGEIDIEGAPTVYFAMSRDPRSLDRAADDPDFGYGALERRVSFLGDTSGLKRLRIFDEFIKLKEREKLYRVSPGALELSRPPGGQTAVRGTFFLPSRIAPDTYQVRLSVLQEGRLVDSRTAPLAVRLVGLPELLSSLGCRHGGLHGLLAVSIALIFGYLTGVVFKKTKPDPRQSKQIETAA